MSNRLKLIVILGPTGVGKTELCLTVAEHLGCDIINCDSRQLFQDIPVGTAAPSAVQQQRVRHYFVGTLPLDAYYSASEYEHDVLQLIASGKLKTGNGKDDTPQSGDIKDTNTNDNAIYGNGRSEAVILSGGSMMYIDAVCNGIDEMPTINDDLRESLKRRLQSEGLETLSEELHALDPAHWATIDKRNPRRILHALEVCLQTGQPYSSFINREKAPRPFDVIKIGLTRPRDELYSRINQRVLDMISDGMIDEARRVYPLRHLNSLNTVGYKELFAYFDGTMTLDEAIQRIQKNTRVYMKKQETWFKRDASIRWFHPNDVKEIIKYIDDLL